jgi:hypothetical protein
MSYTDCSLAFQPKTSLWVQISATSPYFLNSIYTNSICTTERQLIASKFQWEFHYVHQELDNSTVLCALTQMRMSHPFWTECCANHYVYQAIPNGKLRLKEQWTRMDKYHFNITPPAWDTCKEASLPTPYIYLGPSLLQNTDFLLAASTSTLKITQCDVKGTEYAKVMIQ